MQADEGTRPRQIRFDDINGLRALVSDEYGPFGPALEVTQEMIDRFAELTCDPQWIHVDVERAQRESPFGTTIAHGFFVLSLMAGMTDGSNVEITGAGLIINYGADKLRFVTPVPSGSHIHMHSRIADVRQRGGGSLVKAEYEIWVVGADRPALFYRPLSLFLPEK